MASSETSARPRRALLIATDQYNDENLSELRAPEGDVNALAEVLAQPEIGGFDVRPPLTNEPKDVVCEEIEDFFETAGKDELLLLYLSGHGVLSPNRALYFAAANTKLKRLRATGIPASFINEVMEHSRSRRVVLMQDCCHSGAFPQAAAKGTSTVDVGSRFDGQGRVILSASTELEYAYEDQHMVGTGAAGSLFTRMVVEGLESGKADVDQDGKVSIDELYGYVYERVRDETRYQTPELTGRVRGDILIATSPHVVTQLPEALRKELEDPIVSRRLGAVHELAGLLSSADAGLRRAAEQQLQIIAAEDDSRSVSSAATDALTKNGAQDSAEPPTPPEPDPDPEPPAPPDFDHLTAEEREKLASEGPLSLHEALALLESEGAHENRWLVRVNIRNHLVEDLKERSVVQLPGVRIEKLGGTRWSRQLRISLAQGTHLVRVGWGLKDYVELDGHRVAQEEWKEQGMKFELGHGSETLEAQVWTNAATRLHIAGFLINGALVYKDD